MKRITDCRLTLKIGCFHAVWVLIVERRIMGKVGVNLLVAWCGIVFEFEFVAF